MKRINNPKFKSKVVPVSLKGYILDDFDYVIRNNLSTKNRSSVIQELIVDHILKKYMSEKYNKNEVLPHVKKS